MSRNFQLRADVIETVRSYCESQGVSTYIWVQLDEACSVPRSFAQGNAIVLDISELAVNRFSMADGWLVFQARFGEANEIETIKPNCARRTRIGSAERCELYGVPDDGRSEERSLERCPGSDASSRDAQTHASEISYTISSMPP